MKDKMTDIQIIPIKPNNGHVGFANFIYDNAFYFSSIGIYTRPYGGYRLTFPTRKTPSGAISVFHPINKETSNLIEHAILPKFESIFCDQEDI